MARRRTTLLRYVAACACAAGLPLLAAPARPLGAGGAPFRAQVREMDPRLKSILERERYLKRGYVQKDGRWVKAVPPPRLERLVKELPEGSQARLKVHMMDVGQGDTILLQTPNGKNILVDAGFGPTDWSDYDAGKSRVLPYLEHLGLKKLDAVVVSHPHNDHLGGIASVLEGMEVGELIDSGFRHTSSVYYRILELVKERGVKYRQVKAGDTLDFDPAVTIEVLNPPGPNAYNGTNSDANNSSIVLRVTCGEVTALLAGDAEKEAEEKMLRSRYNLGAQILKVGHHGSKTSSTERFLEKVNPEVAIISCGLNNQYGLPKDEILRRYERKRVKIYRTDFDSTVVVATDGKFYTVKAFADVPAEYKGYIIGDVAKKKFYMPGSRYYARVYPSDRRYFKTETDARDAGFEKSYY